MLMGGENVFVWFSDPKTIGGLADKNTDRRIIEVSEEEEKKREKKRAEGKYVAPKEITTPWERPERKIDRKLRKEMRNEQLAKSKSRKSSPRPNRDDILKNRGNEKHRGIGPGQ